MLTLNGGKVSAASVYLCVHVTLGSSVLNILIFRLVIINIFFSLCQRISENAYMLSWMDFNWKCKHTHNAHSASAINPHLTTFWCVPVKYDVDDNQLAGNYIRVLSNVDGVRSCLTVVRKSITLMAVRIKQGTCLWAQRLRCQYFQWW